MPEEQTLDQNPVEQPDTGADDIVDVEKLKKLAGERDQFLDMLQRTRADFENYQKRANRDRDQERKYAYGPIVLDMLSALDNLERAIAAAQQAGDSGPLVQGVVMAHTQFLDILKRHGITRIDAQGQPFDPNRHQAVMQQPSDQAAPNTVLQVLEQGYMNQDRVLRPAKVIVSTKPT